VRVVHLVIGWSIVAGFAFLWLWGLGAWIGERVLRRVSGPGRGFWWVLAFLQAAVLVQGAAGVILLVIGGRASALHYVYGIVFPVLVLLTAHVLAREIFSHRPWIVFAWASFFNFGLTLRALMTGLGYR
jgi:hypothetical protein